MNKPHFVRFLFFGSFLFTMTSCDDGHKVDHPELVTWEKIEFTNEGTIYAIYGDLDNYLLISTLTKILRTSDGGKNWETVKQVSDGIGDFRLVDDALYAVSNSGDYVSYDEGQTWTEISTALELFPPFGGFSDSKGFLYEIVAHYNGELGLPTTVLRSINNGSSWEIVFPYRHLIYTTHIDANDRVYLGASGVIWDGNAFTDDPQFRAYLYYTK